MARIEWAEPQDGAARQRMLLDATELWMDESACATVQAAILGQIALPTWLWSSSVLDEELGPAPPMFLSPAGFPLRGDDLELAKLVAGEA